ncbi:NAD-binding protein [Haladaptatus cibarius]|uniref:NAD-binding protein n=1 Tax=Haladaptatus cibarius TaxID=453847 RepID=UPI000678D112
MALRERTEHLPIRFAVLLTVLAGGLSIGTGAVTITSGGGGFFAGFVPVELQQLAAFSGSITGFLLLVGAVGLRRGLRVAWYATMILLPVAALHGILQSSPYSIPLVVVSLVTILLLYSRRNRFTQPISLTAAQLAAITAIFGILLYGTVGAYTLRDGFEGVSTPFDAFYYTIVTASTVGYGDVQPVTQDARWFGMSVIVLGGASFAGAIGVLVAPLLEARFASALGRMTESQLEFLDEHLLVLGYGQLFTEAIFDELGDGTEYVIVVSDPDLGDELRDRDRNVRDEHRNVVVGDPSDEELLQRVGIERAKSVLVATDDDADDALCVLTARQLNPDVRIVAGASDRENVEKFRRAGADVVVSPAFIGHLLVKAAVGDNHAEELADQLAGNPRNRTLDDF